MRPSHVLASLGLVASLLAGCHRYRGDVEAVCDAEQRTAKQGATKLEQLDRAVLAIGPTLRTPQGKKLAARLMAEGVDPGKLLQAEAGRAGVTSCALADAYLVERERVRWEHDLGQMCAWKVDELAGKKLLTERGSKFLEELRALDEATRRARLYDAAKDAGFAGCAQAKPR